MTPEEWEELERLRREASKITARRRKTEEATADPETLELLQARDQELQAARDIADGLEDENPALTWFDRDYDEDEDIDDDDD